MSLLIIFIVAITISPVVVIAVLVVFKIMSIGMTLCRGRKVNIYLYLRIKCHLQKTSVLTVKSRLERELYHFPHTHCENSGV